MFTISLNTSPNFVNFLFVTTFVLSVVLGQFFECPSGWTQWSENGACYLVIRQVCNWDQCEAECVRYDSHLASVHSQAENEFVESLTNNWAPGYEIVTNDEKSSGDRGEIQFKSYWIGMHRSAIGPVSCGGPKNTVCSAGSFICEWSDGSPMDYGCITHSITAPVGYPWRGGPAGATGIGMPDFSSGMETCITMYPRYFWDRREQPWHGLWNDLNCEWNISGGICKLELSGPAPPPAGLITPRPYPILNPYPHPPINTIVQPPTPAQQQSLCCDCQIPAMNQHSMPLGGCMQLAWIPAGLNSQPAGCLQTQGLWCLLSGLGWWQSTPYGNWLCIQPGFTARRLGDI